MLACDDPDRVVSLGQNAANGRFEPKLTASISVELTVADWARPSHPALSRQSGRTKLSNAAFPVADIGDSVVRSEGAKMKSRLFGSLIGGTIGFLAGAGTGIVGGVFGAIAGVLVFTAIGAAWGWSAGPDLMHSVQRWRGK
jgi:hypothetical protein